jgi:hypothetical protein
MKKRVVQRGRIEGVAYKAKELAVSIQRVVEYNLNHTNGEHLLSFFSLFGGWVFIYRDPGIAVLRCFRVFRLLW